MNTLRDALRDSFPESEADPPRVPDTHVVSDGSCDLGVIENRNYRLLVRQDCFENNTIDTIAGALHQLDYGTRLRSNNPVVLGHVSSGAAANALETWGDWYLVAG